MQNMNTMPYGVNSQKAVQVIVSGFFAGLAMVGVSIVLRTIGISAPEFGSQYGAILNEQIHPATFTGAWWLGMLWHLTNTTLIFSFLFDYLGHKGVLPNDSRNKGLLYGAGIWLVVSALVAPMAGEGFFFRFTPNPILMTLSNLVCWAVYGMVLSGMIRVRTVHQMGISEKRAA